MNTKSSSQVSAIDISTPLAEAITAATRSIHTKLNKLIIARLPLAIPPRTPTPTAYTTGLLHVALIYITFESLWEHLLCCTPAATSDACSQDPRAREASLLDAGSVLAAAAVPAAVVPASQLCERVHSVLRNLHLPELMRTERLKADIRELTGWSDDVIEEQLGTISQLSPLADFLVHIRRAIGLQPHVVVAYSYVFFMALFAGGRFIRASLEAAGDRFWRLPLTPIRPTIHECDASVARLSQPASQMSDEAILQADERSHAAHAFPLRFFHFPTPFDGEDLKREFKQRLVDSENDLTPCEKEDIVKEAVRLFDHMILLVHQLDSVCAGSDSIGDMSSLSAPAYSFDQTLQNPMASRLRDSVVVTKERSARSSSKHSSGSDESNGSVIRRSIHDSADGQRKANSETSSDLPSLHAVIDADSCPTMVSKAVRFQTSSSQATESSSILHSSLQTVQGWAPSLKRLQYASFAQWALGAAISALGLGIFVASLHSS